MPTATNIHIIIDNPKNLTQANFNNFVDLLKIQGQVGTPNIEWIFQCLYLCILYDDNTPFGIGAIKPKYSTPFQKSDNITLIEKYNYELGYLFVIDDPKYRNQGWGIRICRALLEKVDINHIYVTTEINENNRMIHILEKLGFGQVGINYTGQITGKEIGLFIFNPTN